MNIPPVDANPEKQGSLGKSVATCPRAPLEEPGTPNRRRGPDVQDAVHSSKPATSKNASPHARPPLGPPSALSLQPPTPSPQRGTRVGSAPPDPRDEWLVAHNTDNALNTLIREVGSDPDQVAAALEKVASDTANNDRVWMPGIGELNAAQATRLVYRIAFAWTLRNGHREDMLTAPGGRAIATIVGASLSRTGSVVTSKKMVQALRALAPIAARCAERVWVENLVAALESQGPPAVSTVGSWKAVSPVDETGTYTGKLDGEGIAVLRLAPHARGEAGYDVLRAELRMLDALRHKGVPVLDTYGGGGSATDAVVTLGTSEPIVFSDYVPDCALFDAKTPNVQAVEILTLCVIAGDLLRDTLNDCLGGSALSSEMGVAKLCNGAARLRRAFTQALHTNEKAITSRAHRLAHEARSIWHHAAQIGDLQILARRSSHSEGDSILHVIDPIALGAARSREELKLRFMGKQMLESIYRTAQQVSSSAASTAAVNAGTNPRRPHRPRATPTRGKRPPLAPR